MAGRHLIKPSTTAFFAHEGLRTPGCSLHDWLHGYVYARWPYLHIGIGTGEHRLARIVGPVLTWLRRQFTARPAGGRSARAALWRTRTTAK